jgi:hypothetical protein
VSAQPEINVGEHFKKLNDSIHASFFMPIACSRAEAEEKLQMQFPRSYLDLVGKVEEVGCASMDIVESYEAERCNYWPEYLVPFYQDGYGNCYCFDRRTRSEDGEYPIVFWDHHLTRDENIVRVAEVDVTFSNGAWRVACEPPVAGPCSAWRGI